MSANSKILAELAPQIAPTDETVDDGALVGMWSYRDGEVERLMWRGGDRECDQLESAVETALWLFEDRRTQGDSATIEMADGTVVIEHGNRGVIAAWYGEAPGSESGANDEHGGLGLQAQTSAYDEESEPTSEDEPETFDRTGDSATGEGSLSIETRPDATTPTGRASGGPGEASSTIGAPATSDARESAGEAHRRSTESASRRPNSPSVGSATSRGDDPAGATSRHSAGSASRQPTDSNRPAGVGSRATGSAADDRSLETPVSRATSAPDPGPSGSRGADPGRRTDPPSADEPSQTPPGADAETDDEELEELSFEIAFVDSDTSDSPTSEPSTHRDPVCDWATAVDHLRDLTDVAGEHLGKTVTLNYWRNAFDGRAALDGAVAVDLHDGLEASDGASRVDPGQARQLHEARIEWLERCRRTVPSTATAIHETPTPPWAELIEVQ